MESLLQVPSVLLLVCTLMLSGCFGGGAAVDQGAPAPSVIVPLAGCEAPHGPPRPGNFPPGSTLMWMTPPPSAEHQPVWVNGNEFQRLMVIQQASGSYPSLQNLYMRACVQVDKWTAEADGSTKTNNLVRWTQERDRLKVELEQAALALGMRYEEPGPIEFPLPQAQGRQTQKK